jgi:hypothetical protein
VETFTGRPTNDQPGNRNAASGHQSILGDFMLTIACAKCGKVGRIPEAHMGHSVRCKACGSSFQTVPPHTPPPDGLLVASEAVPSEPQIPTTPSSPNQSQGDERNETRVTHCPYCMKVIDPPPKRSRKCPFCREKLILRRRRLFTVSQGAEFDARLAAERALKETAREAEQARYVCLPEQPASEEQYRQIIRRNAYVWSLARFENGRFILLPEQERERRRKFLPGFQTEFRSINARGKLVEHLISIEDWDRITKLSYGRINLVTGLVAWRKEPMPFDTSLYFGLGSPEQTDATFRRLGEAFLTFEPPFP